MSDLVAFLTARLDEDERPAEAYRDGLGNVHRWRADERGGIVRQEDPSPILRDDVIAKSPTHMDAVHIARHDPARVLTEVAVKRAILTEYVGFVTECGEPSPDDFSVDGGVARALTLLAVLSQIATVYANHPDYDPTWRQTL